MDPRVAQLKDTSLQSCCEPLHVQQDRVWLDPALVVQRSARRITIAAAQKIYFFLLLNIPKEYIYMLATPLYIC